MKKRRKRNNFSLEQKCYIYFKYHGICQFCKKNKRITWNKDFLQFHHVIFCCNGGPTSIKNGIPIHKLCHKILHQKKGKDPTEKSELF
jgi:hypothetical protein